MFIDTLHYFKWIEEYFLQIVLKEISVRLLGCPLEVIVFLLFCMTTKIKHYDLQANKRGKKMMAKHKYTNAKIHLFQKDHSH